MPRSALATWAAALLFVAVLIGGWLHASATIDGALRDHVATVTRLAAEQAVLAMDKADLALLSIQGDLRPTDFADPERLPAPRRAALQALLAQAQARDANLASLALTDAEGNTVAALPPLPAPVNGQYREATSAARADERIQVSSMVGQASQEFRAVRLVRPMTRADGQMVGAIVAHVVFERGLATPASPTHGGDEFIALSDGRHSLIAGDAPRPDFLVQLVDELTGKEAFAAETGPHQLHAPSVGPDSLVAVQQLTRYPLFIVYGKNLEAQQTLRTREKLIIALAAMMALLVTVNATGAIRRRAALTIQLQQARTDLEQSNDALRAALAATELVAAKDQLTDLWNRRNFNQRLQEAIAHLARHEGDLSLLMIDIDHFKAINDHLGHPIGDEVLKQVADVLRERLRQNDVAARWGGEEFVVLADGTALDSARLLAEQIRGAVESAPFPGDDPVTISIGIAGYRRGETADQLLTRADDALYDAKRGGRNRVSASVGDDRVALIG
jgi:diguanylate cyclase (GGDEF)-like protein